MYRPNRWKSWNFGFSDIPERPYSQTNISSDSIYEDHEAAPVHRSVSSRGLDEQRQSKGSAFSPGLEEQRQSKGFLKKIRGFFKRIKPGGKKRSVTKGRSVNALSADTASCASSQGTQSCVTDHDYPQQHRPRCNPFSIDESGYGVSDDGTEIYRRTQTAGIHADYGTVGECTIERTQSFTVTDTISFRSSIRSSTNNSCNSNVSGKYINYGRIDECTLEKTPSFNISDTREKKSPETKLQDLFFITSHIANSIEDADSSSLDSTSETLYQEKQEKSHEKIWRDVSTQISLNSKVDADSTLLHTTSDTSYQEKQDFHSDCKGFPFNVARLLAIKFKVEERFVVPTTDARGKHTFIIYDKEQGRDRITTEFGQKVLIRNPKSIQSEGIAITNYCREKRLDLKPTKRASLKNIIQKHKDKLFIKHSNINFISTSPVKSCWNGDIVRDEACIVIYCSSKGYVPFGEDKFPKLLTVGEVIASTDIREGYFQFGPYAYATSRSSDIHDRLKMGCQFGVEGGSTSGTIGPVVNLNGEMAFLTCAHIIYGIDQNGYTFDDSGGDIYIEQPSSTNFGSTGNRCGKVKRAVFRPNLPSSVDAAVVEITEQSRQPVSGEFAVDNPIRLQQAGFDDLPYFNSGKIHMNPNTIDSDKRMVKFGSETHVTRGTLISEGTVVTPVSTEMGLFSQTGKKVLMRNQLEIAGITSHGAFFQPGDSGSGVFFVDRTGMGQELTCIGMAIGSTSNGTAIVTPILDILDALQLPRSLWQFP